MRWRDVPVGEVRYWCGTPFRRTSNTLVDFSDRGFHIEVEYVADCGPDDDRVTAGTAGLIAADDEATERPEGILF